jgi:hypothetical protein
MKVFHVSNYESGSWGFYQNIDLVVLAESEAEAIDKANRAYGKHGTGLHGKLRSDLWKAEELTEDVNYISSSES